MNRLRNRTSVAADAHFRAAAIADDLRAVRERAPLVHNVTNFVVMQQTANALLAIGASPIMAHAEAELDELLAYAGALVLNIGTLDAPWIRAMEAALAAARARALAGGAGSRRRGRESAAHRHGHAAARQWGRDDPARERVGDPCARRGPPAPPRGWTARSPRTRHATRRMPWLPATAVRSSSAAWSTTASIARARSACNNGVAMMARITGMGCTAIRAVRRLRRGATGRPARRRRCHGGDGRGRRTGVRRGAQGRGRWRRASSMPCITSILPGPRPRLAARGAGVAEQRWDPAISTSASISSPTGPAAVRAAWTRWSARRSTAA